MTVFASVSVKVSEPFGTCVSHGPHETVDSMAVKHCHYVRSPCRDQDPSGKKVGSVGQGLPGACLALLHVHGLACPL